MHPPAHLSFLCVRRALLGLAVALSALACAGSAHAAENNRLGAAAAVTQATGDDSDLAGFTRQTARRYQRLLPATRPTARAWQKLRRAGQRDLRAMRGMRPTTATGRAQRTCAIKALRSIVSGSTAGRDAYREFARGRRGAYKRALRRTRTARAGVARLGVCANMTARAPGGSNAPTPPPPPAPPSPPPPSVPPAPGRAPAAQITRFEAIVDILGPQFPFRGAPGGVITGCAPAANAVSVWFATEGVEPDDLTVVWSIPEGVLARLAVLDTDALTGESISRIRRASGLPFPNVTFTVTVELAGVPLDTSTVRLAC
jgi:hypothetical protein